MLGVWGWVALHCDQDDGVIYDYIVGKWCAVISPALLLDSVDIF